MVSFQIRDLSRSENPAAIVFYFALFGTLIMTPFLPFAMTAHGGREWLLPAATGIVAAGMIVAARERRLSRTPTPPSALNVDYACLDLRDVRTRPVATRRMTQCSEKSYSPLPSAASY